MSRHLPLVAAALVATAPPAAAQDGPKRYAVLVGVNRYDQPHPSVR